MEQNRLDLYHHIFLLFLDGGLYHAPISHPRRILDVGTGTGIWAVEMAEKFPDAEVIGNDLSPIQPTWTWPNLRFEIDDVELEWTYRKDSFDFVHMRCLSASINDWEGLLSEAFKCLAPGGYLEFSDHLAKMNCDDGTFPRDSTVRQWMDLVHEASEIARRPLRIADKIAGLMREIGFEDVHERVYKWPIGPWSKEPKEKEIGRWSFVGALDSCSLAMALLTRYLGWRKEEVDILVAKAMNEIKNGRMHIYATVYFVYGRKPEKLEEIGKAGKNGV